MKTSRKGLRLAAALLALCLLPLGGTAEEAAIGTEEKGLTLGECVLTYPAVTGLPEALGETVNSRLLEDTRIPDYLTRMSQLISGGSLTVGWTGGLLGDVLSCAVSAEGAVTSPRPAHVWTWSTIDL
ncbi:MAG: hypothetical protein IJQ88_01510, partial [Clostridia bacterium]|nr:hypothetical protein [Clostridia bacterium]